MVKSTHQSRLKLGGNCGAGKGWSGPAGGCIACRPWRGRIAEATRGGASAAFPTAVWIDPTSPSRMLRPPRQCAHRCSIWQQGSAHQSHCMQRAHERAACMFICMLGAGQARPHHPAKKLPGVLSGGTGNDSFTFALPETIRTSAFNNTHLRFPQCSRQRRCSSLLAPQPVL